MFAGPAAHCSFFRLRTETYFLYHLLPKKL